MTVSLGRFQVVGVVGGILMALGSFLPWVTATAPFVGTISRSGLDGGGDGIIILVAGVLGALAVMFGSRGGAILGSLAGAAGFIVGIFDYLDLQNRVASASSEFGVASVGAGIFVVVLGAVLLFVGASYGIRGGVED